MSAATGRYTSGRIAVANLTSMIDGLELRRINDATFEHLVGLSKLLFVRGDVLGRIVDHDEAECAAHHALAWAPDTASALYIRAWLAERFHQGGPTDARKLRAVISTASEPTP